jgi:hypothetical protein
MLACAKDKRTNEKWKMANGKWQIEKYQLAMSKCHDLPRNLSFVS